MTRGFKTLTVGDDYATPLTHARLRKIGKARLVRRSYEPGVYRMEGVDGYEYFSCDDPLPVTALERKDGQDWKVWMVDDPLHWFGMRAYVNRLPGGRIVCAGLGLGLMTHHLVARTDVTRIEVFEIDPDVIRLIGPTLPKDKRVQLVADNFYAALREGEFKNADGILWDLAVGSGDEPKEAMFEAAVMFGVFAPGVPFVRFGDKGVLDKPVLA